MQNGDAHVRVHVKPLAQIMPQKDGGRVEHSSDKRSRIGIVHEHGLSLSDRGVGQPQDARAHASIEQRTCRHSLTFASTTSLPSPSSTSMKRMRRQSRAYARAREEEAAWHKT